MYASRQDTSSTKNCTEWNHILKRGLGVLGDVLVHPCWQAVQHPLPLCGQYLVRLIKLTL